MNTIKIALLALVPFLTVSCASTQSNSDQPAAVNPDNVKEWWKRPGLFGKYATVGTAKVVANQAQARTRAEVDGRNKLAASIRSVIQSVQENWSQEAGDLLDEETLSSMLNDESFIRQMVDTTMMGSVVDRYEVADGYMYVLMKLEDAAAFENHLISKVSLPKLSQKGGDAPATEVAAETEAPAPVEKASVGKHRVRKTTNTTLERDN